MLGIVLYGFGCSFRALTCKLSSQKDNISNTFVVFKKKIFFPHDHLLNIFLRANFCTCYE